MNQTFALCLLAIISVHFKSFAQTNRAPVKVAVFAPLYINDAFDGDNYKLGKLSLPKNILPGLEFYNGVMLAIDSLKEEGVSAEVNIYDTKNTADFNQALLGTSLNNTGIIIAAFTNTTELKTLSNVARQKNIPLISATYPNNGNITASPNFIMLNTSLQGHLEGLYKYLQRTYSRENILFLRRPGSVENYIKNTFTTLNKNTNSLPLKMKWVDLTDTFNVYQVTRYLDTTKRNVVVVASPDEAFGSRVVKGINTVDNALTTIVGMPTWDAIREVNKSNAEIVYSTPFRYSSVDKAGYYLVNKYRAKYGSRPSDMVFRGFESMYHFTKLLIKNGSNFLPKISDADYTLFNQFDIVPVVLKTENKQPDYYENKKLYFIKKQKGEVVAVSNY